MTKARNRPAWVRAARKAIAAHLPAIRAAMAEAFEPHELAIVPRGMGWEDCADENAHAAKQMLRLVQQLNDITAEVAKSVSGHLQDVTGRFCTWRGVAEPWDVESVLDQCVSDDHDWIDDVITDRWREALNELPERDDA